MRAEMRRAMFLGAALSTVLVCRDARAQQTAAVRIWNGDVMSPYRDFDYDAGAKPLRPIVIVAAHRGTFSGKVCLGSTKPIKAVSARMSDLVSPAGRIPAAAVRVSFPPYTPRSAWLTVAKGVPLFDGLFAKAAESPLITRPPDRKRIDYIPMGHAFQPVWVTVRVPPGARPGEYAGTLTVRAEGAGPFAAAVKLTVHDYVLPEPGDYATFTELIQSPESVAIRCGVAPWSDRHFELIARSFDLIGGIGSRSVYIPLICQTNMGNDQSMVRWIDKGGGSWAYDFSVMEKYLDAAARHMGKPKIVGLVVWDIFLEGGPKNPKEVDAPKAMAAGAPDRRPRVSVLKAGKLETRALPPYSDPKSASLWKPMLVELRRRLKKRGLDGAVMWGIATDYVPAKEVVAHFAGIAPGVPWIHHSHSFYGGRDRRIAAGGAPVRYAAHVWCHRPRPNPPKVRYYGWRPSKKRPGLVATHYHRGLRENSGIATYRLLAEMNLAADRAGFGRLGADFWPVFKGRRGRLSGRVSDGRFPQSTWRNLDIRVALLAAGPEGAEPTARFEMLREGVQECEARIFIEKALLDDARRAKLGQPLARKCQALLDDRTRAIGRAFLNERRGKKSPGDSVSIGGYETYLQWDWQEHSDRLYAAAAQVAAKLGG